MGRRRAPSLESISRVIADIHDAGVDGAAWPVALRRLGGLFDAPTTTVWVQDPTGRFRDIQTMGPEDAFTHDYAAYYGRLDLLRPAVMASPAGTVLTNEMVVPRSDFVRTEFYTDFAAPHGLIDCIQARIFEGSSGSGYVGITRSLQAEAFECEHVRLAQLLLPHLGRAMQMQHRLACLCVERDCALEALDRLHHGVLVVDAQMRVLHANKAAVAILRKGDGLGVEPASRQLRASAPGQTAALRRLVAQAAGGLRVEGVLAEVGDGTLRLDRAAEGPLLVSVAPLRAETTWNVSPQPAALVLVGEPRREAAPTSPTHLRALYDLTAAEAAVAGRIALGEGVKDAAAALGMAPSTLRWHLRHVFDKTGTARQAELARLVERLGAVADGSGCPR